MAVRPVGGSWPVRACSDVAIVAVANLEGEAEKPQPPDATALREAVRLRMSPPNRESVTEIGRDTRITTGRPTEHRSVLAPWLPSCPVSGFHRYSRVHSGVMPMPKDVTSNRCHTGEADAIRTDRNPPDLLLEGRPCWPDNRRGQDERTPVPLHEQR